MLSSIQLPADNIAIRSVIQVLKLSGRFLEEEPNNVLDKIFKDLNEICCSSDNLTE